MTVILALRDGKKGCYMAADRRVSHSGEGSWFGKLAEPKIRTKDVGDLKILYATRGSVAFGRIMDGIVWPLEEITSVKDYLNEQIIPLIQKGMEVAKYEPEKKHYSGAVICIEDQIFTVDHFLSLVEHGDDFIAYGDGASAAYGAYDMFTRLANEDGVRKELMLQQIITVVSKRNWSCDGHCDTFTTFNDE